MSGEILAVDDEFRDLITPLTRDELDGLKANVLKNGCLDAIKTWAGIIVDGHNRYSICSENGISFDVRQMDFSDRRDALNWIIDNQLSRRNLAPWQMSVLRGKRYNAEKTSGHGTKSGYQNDTQRTRENLAEQFGVSSATISRDADFAKAADIAARQTNTPLMQLTKSQILEAAKQIQLEKRAAIKEQRIETIAQANANNKPLNGIGPFSVILADPPWQYEHTISDSRAIENQYPTMPIEDICALPVQEICSDDAVLFMWVSTPMLEKGLQALNAWGFQYRTGMVWVKPSIGPGHWVRQRHELLLIGVRGNIPTPQNKPDSVIEAPRTGHSEKPTEMYEIIERMYPTLERVELFCRNPREGWKAWGNQS